MPALNRIQQHAAVCPLEKVFCPRGGADCGAKKNAGVYRRRDEQIHADLCTSWRCSTPHCTTVGPRNTIRSHTPGCVELHAHSDSLLERTEALADALNESQAENKKLRTALDGLELGFTKGEKERDKLVKARAVLEGTKKELKRKNDELEAEIKELRARVDKLTSGKRGAERDPDEEEKPKVRKRARRQTLKTVL